MSVGRDIDLGWSCVITATRVVLHHSSVEQDGSITYQKLGLRVGVLGQVIMRDKYTNRPRGFGFLTLKDEDTAARICDETHVLDGRQVWP